MAKIQALQALACVALLGTGVSLALAQSAGSAASQSSGRTIPSGQTGITTSSSSTERDANSPYVDDSGTGNGTGNEEPAQSSTRNSNERRNRLENPAPPAPEEPPTDFQRLVQSSMGGKLLPLYGRNFFHSPSSFMPVSGVPATSSYVVGPGDEVLVRAWGQVAFNDHLTVDRSGDIYVPRVGLVHVAGLSYQQLDPTIRTAVSRVFRNFDLSVNLGQLRSIPIFVVGNAVHPGRYTVSSLSTLVSAVFASGGPSAQGSMRHIELRRENQSIVDFDLYDLLLRGDTSRDVRLLPGDILVIHPVGPQVAVAGSVKVPAIYELKGKSTVKDLLEMAGGLSTTSLTSEFLLERMVEHRDRKAMHVTLNAEGFSLPVEDGDALLFDSVTQRFVQSVTLRGNVANPGRFRWHEGMKLSELIPDSASLVTKDYWRIRNQMGLPTPLFLPQQAQPSVEDASQPQTVKKTPLGTRIPEDPTSSGHTLAGSSLSTSSEKETATPEILNVRISVPEIDWSYAVIERLDPVKLTNILLPFNLGWLVQGHDATQDLELQPGDVVTIFSQGDIHVPLQQQTKYIHLEGEFASAGIYSALPGETLRQLVQRAGGLTPNAYLFGSQFTRESARRIQQQRIEEYTQRVSADLERNAATKTLSTINVQDAASQAAVQASEREVINRLHQVQATGRIVLEIKPGATDVSVLPDLPLEDGDTFVVPARPANINVVGAVYDQNSFLFDARRSVGSYLRLAGGYNRTADKKHAFVIRADGSVFSKETTRSLWGDSFEQAPIYPGDTIVVPEKLASATAMRNFLDWSQIFTQLTLGAAAINVLK